MKALTYTAPGQFRLIDKPLPVITHPRDAIIRVTLSSICTSDLHILHGHVPQAVPGITVGHEMIGIVETVGDHITHVKPGDRVSVNVETYCGHCYYCRRGWVNNCTDPLGGWALGCRIDGGQATHVRIPLADNGLTPIPDNVTDRQALLVGDILATGYWAARISDITPDDTVLIIGAGPTGLCTIQSVLLHLPRHIIVCEIDPERRRYVSGHHPQVTVVSPDECDTAVRLLTQSRGADRVIEVAGAPDTPDTFTLAWQCARPNAIVTIVALYDRPQLLPLPHMYGKNLTFKTGGVDGCDSRAILQHIADGHLDTTPLITHSYPLSRILDAYDHFEHRRDNVIKIAIHPD